MKGSCSPGGYDLDTSPWPLVYVRSPTRAVSDDELDQLFEKQRSMLARGERYIQLTDTESVHILPASQRKRMADFLRETDALTASLCVAIAVVVRGPVYRGGLTAVLWLFRPSYPIRAVANHAEAAAFLVDAAAKAGLSLSPAARACLANGGPTP